jgi:hypothetical protein
MSNASANWSTLTPHWRRAAYDWGFGDWEDCLGAASHVGNREIAEYLISNGARPTIFSAAMLGQLDAVKAFIAAQPGAQRIPGPHSIPLLAHARAGGAAAAAVHSYLEGLGDAGAPPTQPMSDEEKTALVGSYVFGRGAADRIEITLDKGTLMFQRQGMPFGRGLLHLGDKTFHPAGAGAVRVKVRQLGGNRDADGHRRRDRRDRDQARVGPAEGGLHVGWVSAL